MPKKVLSDTTELNMLFTVSTEATWVVGGQEEEGDGYHPLYRDGRHLWRESTEGAE